MRGVVKSGFFWPFAGGFVLGTLGLFAMQPTDAAPGSAHHAAGIVRHRR